MPCSIAFPSSVSLIIFSSFQRTPSGPGALLFLRACITLCSVSHPSCHRSCHSRSCHAGAGTVVRFCATNAGRPAPFLFCLMGLAPFVFQDYTYLSCPKQVPAGSGSVPLGVWDGLAECLPVSECQACASGYPCILTSRFALLSASSLPAMPWCPLTYITALGLSVICAFSLSSIHDLGGFHRKFQSLYHPLAVECDRVSLLPC